MTTRTQKRSSRPSSTCPSSRHPSPRSPTPGNSAPASSTSTTTSTVIPGSPGTPPPRSISGPPARSTRPGRTLSPPPATPTPSGSAAGHTPGHAGAVLDQPAGTRNPNELTETVSFDLTDSALRGGVDHDHLYLRAAQAAGDRPPHATPATQDHVIPGLPDLPLHPAPPEFVGQVAVEQGLDRYGEGIGGRTDSGQDQRDREDLLSCAEAVHLTEADGDNCLKDRVEHSIAERHIAQRSSDQDQQQ